MKTTGDRHARWREEVLMRAAGGLPVVLGLLLHGCACATEPIPPHQPLELAGLHKDGKLVPLDLERAARLYADAAGQGDAVAQLALGLAYCLGEGVTQNLEKAKRCVKLAFDNPDAGPDLRRKCDAVWNRYRLYDY